MPQPWKGGTLWRLWMQERMATSHPPPTRPRDSDVLQSTNVQTHVATCASTSHGGARLAAVGISSHQSVRASWFAWLVRPDPCHPRDPLACMASRLPCLCHAFDLPLPRYCSPAAGASTPCAQRQLQRQKRKQKQEHQQQQEQLAAADASAGAEAEAAAAGAECRNRGRGRRRAEA